MRPISIKTRRRFPHRAAATLVAGALGLAMAGCGSPAEPSSEPSSAASSAPAEIEGPRVTVSYDGGVLVLDSGDLEVVADMPLDGFLRLNPSGDGRHVMVSTEDGFRVLDTGVLIKGHGDHNHYYGQDAQLTDVTYPAPEPGHAVVHHDRLALFSDGAGTAQIVDVHNVASGDPIHTWTAPDPHHGVAVPLDDSRLLVTVGTEDDRTGAAVVDADGKVGAHSDECPGVHGETVAAEEAVVLGCEDGALVFRDGKFSKINSPDSYGRIGNVAGSEDSRYVLGDYKTDPDAELERPTRVSIIDTETGKLSLVDLGVSYTFRSLTRGPEGEALVLGTDGALRVIDPAKGKVTATIPVTDEWSEPVEWQQPRPAVSAQGSVAYVTDPATKSVHIVSLATRAVVSTVELPHVPNEIALW